MWHRYSTMYNICIYIYINLSLLLDYNYGMWKNSTMLLRVLINILLLHIGVKKYLMGSAVFMLIVRKNVGFLFFFFLFSLYGVNGERDPSKGNPFTFLSISRCYCESFLFESIPFREIVMYMCNWTYACVVVAVCNVQVWQRECDSVWMQHKATQIHDTSGTRIKVVGLYLLACYVCTLCWN